MNIILKNFQLKKIFLLLYISLFLFKPLHAEEDGYKINFKNVPIEQYLKFISKACDINFIYEDADIEFNVTVVSREDISKKNALATLVQILRVHNLSIIEDGKNVIIHKNPKVKELAPILNEKEPMKNCSAVATKVFQIKNMDLTSTIEIIKGALSDDAYIKPSPASNQIIVTDITKNLNKISELINILDSGNQVFIYQPKFLSKSNFDKALKQIEHDLRDSDEKNLSLSKVIEKSKWLEESNSFMFNGSKEDVNELKAILNQLDIARPSLLKQQMSIFTYQPENRTLEDMEKAVKEMVHNLTESKLSNTSLIDTLKNVRVIDITRSLLFTGDTDSINQVESIVKKFDSKEESEKIQQTYFIYKLTNTSGNIIEEDLDNFAEKLRSKKVQNPSLIYALENAKWIKETNSILITGEPKALEASKAIIEEFDVTRNEQEIFTHSDFYIYKPVHTSPFYIEQSLKDIASNLSKAKLADPNLLNTINNSRIIGSTGSIAFTGTPKAIDKIKILLKDIDIKSAGSSYIHAASDGTYLYFEIKKANPQQLINAVKNFTKDLVATNSKDSDLISALETMKYKPESRALVFNGQTPALEQIQSLLNKLDTEALSKPGSSNYFVYKPKCISGEQLEESLQKFAEHLKSTGFENQALFTVINTMKYNPETKSIIFSGNPAAIEEIKGLITTFDIPKPGEECDILHPANDISFLVYKLQYHKGDEIQVALKQVGQELALAENNEKRLIKSINSIQWIQVTNSLLCSGSKESMNKLKELIANLDVPLKQVFIEMLVIETTFSNLLNFGLDWGGKYKHKDKFVAGVSNSQYSTAATEPSNFIKQLNTLDKSNKVQGSSLGLTQGFDLGIIGDIILHKGKSFLSLGSFLQAVQQDGETSVIMTPKILAQDNKTSSIFIGNNVPYLGSQTNITGAAGNVTQNLEYRDIGMDLTLTPVLGNADIVTLSIDLARTIEQSSTTLSTQTDVEGIRTSKTTMQTTVHIPNQSFLVLSGMVQEQKQRKKTGIPCLGGLPFIGAAFSENDKISDRKNIVIFIRPHIINSYEDMQDITTTQEDYFRSETGSPQLEQDFDEACDFYKTYDE